MKQFLTLLLICCCLQVSAQPADTDVRPKNVVLLIGDGMGLSQVSTSFYFNEETSNFERFPIIGLINTSSSAQLITDSAAGATAFASGIRTYNGAVGVDSKTNAVPTLVEIVSENGMATGIISTSSVVHATPACFYAHQYSRRQYDMIAEQLPNSDLDFVAGGGLQFFQKRKDGSSILSALEEQNFQVFTDALRQSNPNKKPVYLLAEDGMPRMLDGRGDFLPNASQMAIDQLGRSKDGFFLMIEGSQIDWGGHDNDADYLISEQLDFDKAIGVVMDFAEKNGETLVIVTADHETGGLTLASDGGDYNKIKPSFSTGGHSATLIPVFAFGPGAENFSGIYENTQIFHKIMALLKD